MTRSAYPPEWPEVSLAVKIEAGFRCVRCGHPNGRWSPPGEDHETNAMRLAVCVQESTGVRIIGTEDGGAWLRCHLTPCDEHCTHDPDVRDHRVLTVHHLDGDKHNLAWWNLAALCQRCHLEIQGRVKMDQAYLHPHSTWFRPYYAGYIAYTKLGEQLSREEVMERMDELLRVGQPWLYEGSCP